MRRVSTDTFVWGCRAQFHRLHGFSVGFLEYVSYTAAVNTLHAQALATLFGGEVPCLCPGEHGHHFTARHGLGGRSRSLRR